MASFLTSFRLWYYSKPVALRTLIAINVGFYLAWQLLLRFIPGVPAFVYDHLLLHPELPDILWQPWQLVTYSFIHIGSGLSGLLHILFNMLWLYWMGEKYEYFYGSHRMVALYVFAAVGGALLTVVLHALFPGMPNFGGPVYGASAAVIGVLIARAVLHPHEGIALLFLGVIPLKYLAIGFLVLDFLIGFGTQVSLSAHWGGALAGWLFVRLEHGGRLALASWARIFFQRRGRSAGLRQRMVSNLERTFRKEPSAPVSSAPEVDPREIDRILDKISAHGYDALTEEEKRVLYEASRRDS